MIPALIALGTMIAGIGIAIIERKGIKARQIAMDEPKAVEAYEQPPEEVDPFEAEYLEMVHEQRAKEEAELGYADTACECPVHKDKDFEWNVNVAEVNRATRLAKTQVEYIPYVTNHFKDVTESLRREQLALASVPPNSIRARYVSDPYSDRMRRRDEEEKPIFVWRGNYIFYKPSVVPNNARFEVHQDMTGYGHAPTGVWSWTHTNGQAMIMKVPGAKTPELASVNYDRALGQYKDYGNSEYWHEKRTQNLYEIYGGDHNVPIRRFRG